MVCQFSPTEKLQQKLQKQLQPVSKLRTHCYENSELKNSKLNVIYLLHIPVFIIPKRNYFIFLKAKTSVSHSINDIGVEKYKHLLRISFPTGITVCGKLCQITLCLTYF